MIQYLLSAALALAQSQGACEDFGATSVTPAPTDGPNLGCGICPAWTIYVPAHAERVSRPGWRITGTTELPVTRTERRCEQRGSGFFEFLEPDVCVALSNLPHGIVLNYQADLCVPVRKAQ